MYNDSGIKVWRSGIFNLAILVVSINLFLISLLSQLKSLWNKSLLFVQSEIIKNFFSKTSSDRNIKRRDSRKVVNGIGGEFYASQF